MPATGRERQSGNLRSLLITLAIITSVLAMIACAAMVLIPSQAGALASASPTTNLPSWSIAAISKPTYTPSPMPTVTVTPLADATEIAASPTDAPSGFSMSIVDESIAPVPNANDLSQSPSTGKYILVSISEQHLYAYQDGQLVYSFIASTGMGNSTRVGTFHVLDKIPNAYGANWNIWMPDWLGIYWSGSLENGIHALPILPGGARLWSGYLGTPISFGCVVLGVDEALQLYNWADVGTPVEIQR